jgi:murein L,D-transpeptidase YcbB/YkuD
MQKRVLGLSVALIALAVAVTPAFADTVPPQKKGFFESIFGPKPQRQQRRPRQPLFNWFKNTKNADDNQVYYTDPAPLPDPYVSKPKAAVFVDPEPIPGLGMGNPDYIAPRLMPVADPALAKLTPAVPEGAAILAELSNVKSTIRAEAPARKAILDTYKAAGFKPLWVSATGVSDRAKKVLAMAAAAEADGLDPLAYLPDGLTSFDNLDQQLGTDAAKLAHFDVAMSAAALKLALHLSGGQFDPNRLSLYNDINPEQVAPATAMKVLAWSPFAESYLQGLVPNNPAYAALKAELAKLRDGKAKAPMVMIPAGKPVKVGAKDPRNVLLRQRLGDLGFTVDPDAEMTVDDPETLDRALSATLKAFQKSVQIKATGILDSATVARLNVDATARDIRRLVDNLERLRWLPHNLGSRYVFVNQPAFQVDVYDHGQNVWHSKVIVGRPMTQTAAFHDEIETVVFNPSWGVPQSIIVNEYLKKLVRDPGYLDREGFKVINAQGKVVSSSDVNWSGYSVNAPVSVQQPPGSDNALGELKFLFPNKHDIYMHDTPARNLFSQASRAFSHGCVRVENPREFAAVLLGWDRQRIDEKTDSGENASVSLPSKVPVHITYFTAWPDDTGKINYYNDIYGRDAAMEKAAAVQAEMRDAVLAQKLVQN